MTGTATSATSRSKATLAKATFAGTAQRIRRQTRTASPPNEEGRTWLKNWPMKMFWQAGQNPNLMPSCSATILHRSGLHEREHCL